MAESEVPSGGSSLADSCEELPTLSDCQDMDGMDLEDVEHACGLCSQTLQQPRVLSCLHVFCTRCLEKQVEVDEANSEEELENTIPYETPTTSGTIVCSVCKQETKLQRNGVDDLPVDIVLTTMLDKDSGKEVEIICTSCKAREKAVGRCSDCANFLCPACVTAHQFMRCFENHKVVSFEEMETTDGLDLQKPIFCQVHITENLKYFCEFCQVTICQDCILASHSGPNHPVEKIADIEARCREELQMLVTESNSKIKFCDQASSSLEGGLSELQMQRDNARGLIEETFQTYRTILEDVQNELVQELNTRQREQELNIMDMFHNIEKTTERIEDGCKFVERVLENGNPVHVLMMKKLITSQLLVLINNTPKPELNIKVEFATNHNDFERAMRLNFGQLTVRCGSDPQVKPDDEIETDEEEIPKVNMEQEMTLVAGRLGIPPGLIGPPQAMLLPDVPTTDFLSSMSGIPPLNLSNITSLASSISAATETISSITNTIPTLSERSSSRNSYSPAMSDSGISVDAASTSSSSTQPLVNLANFSKLGNGSNISVNQQGQITLNNQAIPSRTINTVTGLPQAIGGRSHTPTPGQTTTEPNSLTNLLNSVGLGSSRSQTPQLSDIPGLASLLSQSPGLNGIGGINAITGASGLLGQQLPSPDDEGLPSLTGLQGNMNVNLSTPPPISGGFNGNLPPFPTRSSGKMSAMQIRCKFGQLGPGKGQFNSPHGFCLGLEEDIIVADTNNHRIQVFEKTGEFKYQFGIPGREEGQLWYPRKVAVICNTGRYVVCDRGNERSRMQIFTKNGHFVKKIAIRYIDIVAGLAISVKGHIVAVDSVSPTVFCIEETGNLLKWFDCSDYMREPSDIAVAGKEYFVCDFKGHCVVVFSDDGQFARRIGCESITNFPNGISISVAGDVLVGDSHGNRFHVAVFLRDGSLIGEFECPYVKVSRCCGLRITSEGYIVTLAKNNHHVLVLNTLYIA